jgi:hypothetical protein
MLGIIKITKDEYKEGIFGIMRYNVYFLGLLIYTVKFTTTNRDIVGKLTDQETKPLHICGFTNNQKK